MSTIHKCELGEFTANFANQSPTFTLVTLTGEIYRATTYTYHMSFTNPLTHGEVQNLFRQKPTLEFDNSGAIRATMICKHNTINILLKKITSEHISIAPIFFDQIKRLEARIEQLESQVQISN